MKETSDINIIWRCYKRGCLGIIKTKLSYIILLERPNNHPKDTQAINDANTLGKKKEKAISTSETPRQAYRIYARV